MNGKTLIAFGIAALMIVGQSCSQRDPTAAHDSHATHSMPAEAPTPPAGQRWPTDEPLRTAMLRIRTAVEKDVPAFESRQLSTTDAQALAAVVQENVTYMIANCKLPPDPDAALHVLIGRMLAAATALKEDPTTTAGVPQLLAALRDYQATFDHAGWPPMAAHQ